MKKIIKKENIIKGAGVLLIFIILLLSNLSAMANSAMGISTQTNIIDKSLSIPSPMFDGSWEIIFDENFTDGVPPTGAWGDWDLNQTNQEETWHRDASDPHSEPYCATVCRNKSLDLQDEWLITPSLDFSKYKLGEDEIKLKFFWFTESYIAWKEDYIDLNVSVSIDGGKNWMLIFTEDDMNYLWTPWIWIEADDGVWIDLSNYAGETDVMIGFEYYSDTTLESDYQEFSIDDVQVLVKSVDFQCHHGGPYKYWYHKQYYFDIPGVRLHGGVSGFPMLECTPSWEFGDGTNITGFWDPIHLYESIGNYTVNFTVKHRPTNRTIQSITYALLNLSRPPEMKINVAPNSFWIKAKIKNVGEYNATYIDWTMSVSGGILQRFERQVANGSITSVEGKSTSDPIKSGYFIGIGLIHIIIEVEPENVPGGEAHFKAIKIGPLILGAGPD